MSEPVEFDAVDPRWAEAMNACCGVARETGLPLGDRWLPLQFEPAPVEVATLLAELEVGGHRFLVGVFDWDAVDAAQELTGGCAFSQLPPALMPAVLEAAFEEPLDALSELTSHRAGITSVSTSEEAPAGRYRLGFTLDQPGGAAVRGEIRTSIEGAQQLAKWVSAVELSPAGKLQDIQSEAVVEAGAAQLNASELAALRPGDVIVLESSTFLQDSVATLRVGGIALRVRVEPDHLHVLDQAQTVPALPTASEASATLSFQHGVVRLTADETVALQAGSTIPYRAAPQVAIICHNKMLGQGELVDVAGRGGVRIVDWSHSSDSQ